MNNNITCEAVSCKHNDGEECSLNGITIVGVFPDALCFNYEDDDEEED